PRRDTIFAWLTTVAIREAIRLDRRDRTKNPLDKGGDHAAQAGTADRNGEERVVFCEVVEELAGIHPRKRDMLLMHAAGFTCAEIATGHGIAPSRAREL